jgi:hypothetical protein
MDFLPFVKDFSGTGMFKTEKNFHQRGFTCAVFSKQRVDLTFYNFYVNVGVCDDSVRIDLPNIAHLQNNLLIVLEISIQRDPSKTKYPDSTEAG